MSNKTILNAMHETARGLHKAGAMDATTLREFDALCLPPVKHYSARQIKTLRLRCKASQPASVRRVPEYQSVHRSEMGAGQETTRRFSAEAAQYC